MPSNAYLYRMPSGIQGASSREENKTIESQPFGATPFPTYGVPYKYAAGTIVPIGASDLASSIAGILLRPYPTSDTGSALGNATPPTSGIANGLKRGYLTVVSNAGTPALGGQAYVRVAAPSGQKVVGGFEAAPDNSVTSPAIVGTGTGTIAASIGAGLSPTAGTWVVKVLTTSATSQLSVTDPNGVAFPPGQIGVAYKSGTGFNFTVTNGGTMTAGDAFSPVVTENTIVAPGCFFNGPADASGNVEIAYNI